MYCFKIKIKIMGKGGLKAPVVAELDTDSQLSIVSKSYFDKYLLMIILNFFLKSLLHLKA
jgi:hypothetical protein